MAETPAYARLESLFARLSVFDGVLSVLQWDMAAMMPEGGGTARAEQLATVRTLRHEMMTAPQMSDWLDAAAAETLDEWQAANLREMRRDWVHAAAVPARLVDALSRACSACEMTWRQARPASDFAKVAPLLEEVLRLTREAAETKAAALGVEPYDALLDQYEPGGRLADIEPVFDDIAAFLPGFLGEVLERQGPAGARPQGPFPTDRQRALGLRFMQIVGFDFHHGRLDVSAHPFCGGIPDDVRITTRYDETDFMPALMGVLHETGHALYEQGLPKAWRGQPVGAARGMSVHESQSLLMEMQACRSRPFMEFAAPILAETFGGNGPEWSAEALRRQYVRVQPGFIRVDADEVSYPAHVILRTRLEKALLGGDLHVRDLPGAWNDGMKQLLGLDVPDDRRGCLQDIHWYDGAWGYFPTYTLGAMTAAQLFDAACRADPQILPAIGRGDFAPLLAWLRTNVHHRGCLLSTRELLTRATGRPLDPKVFEAHLRARYLEGV
jgi:carboxypeptidase Taq